MIKAKDAIAEARKLLGTPYSQLDCINLIKRVIRVAPGGVPGYTTAGTNTLWRSYESTPKYKDLIWRQKGISGADAGMLSFMADGADVNHVGLVTDKGTVIHSSKSRGMVVETPLDSSWSLLAIHRYIEPVNMIDNGSVDVQVEEPEMITTKDDDACAMNGIISIVDSVGNVFQPIGDFKIYVGGID